MSDLREFHVGLDATILVDADYRYAGVRWPDSLTRKPRPPADRLVPLWAIGAVAVKKHHVSGGHGLVYWTDATGRVVAGHIEE